MFGAIAGVAASVIGAKSSNNSASKAAKAQAKADRKAIEEQRRQFNHISAWMTPYRDAGSTGLNNQLALMGLKGDDPQARKEQQEWQIQQLMAGSEYGNLLSAGENAILQNSSATGGLRGGNTQRGLADFRSDLLMELINRQLERYGGLAGSGQNASAQLGAFGQAKADAISSLHQSTGQAKAGASLAIGQNNANMWSGIAGSIGQGIGAYNTNQVMGQVYPGANLIF